MGADNGATPETQRKTRVTLGYTRSHIPSITRALPNCPEGNPETHGNRIEGGSGEEGGEREGSVASLQRILASISLKPNQWKDRWEILDRTVKGGGGRK